MSELAPPKPRYGAPCNGCGFCCAAERCKIGVALLGDGPGPCPGMRFKEGIFRCGVLEEAPPLAQPLIAYMLAIGRGCDAADPAS